MNKIKQDIKNKQFESVYLLCGNESYLIKKYKHDLSAALRHGADDMNYSYYEGKGISISEVIAMSETMPFFADRRVIVIENSGFFKKASPEMTEYIEEMAPTTHIIFVESEIDKRGKLYKTVNKSGYICQIDNLDASMLVKWIVQILREDKIQIQSSTAAFLIEKLGTNMEKLRPELEKLACYAMGRDELTIEDINMVCVGQPIDKIFDIVDQMIDHQSDKALGYYYDLIALNVGTAAILATMANHFRRLVYVKAMGSEGHPRTDIAKVAGIHPHYLDKYIRQSRAYTTEQLNTALEEVIDMTHASRTGGMSDNMAVELLIVKYSMP